MSVTQWKDVASNLSHRTLDRDKQVLQVGPLYTPTSFCVFGSCAPTVGTPPVAMRRRLQPKSHCVVQSGVMGVQVASHDPPSHLFLPFRVYHTMFCCWDEHQSHYLIQRNLVTNRIQREARVVPLMIASATQCHSG